jgi:hypothetical protein
VYPGVVILLLLAACSDYKIQSDAPDPTFDPGDTARPFDTAVDPGVPDIDVNPLSWDAGDVDLASTVSTTVSVANLGDATLTLSDVVSDWTLSEGLAGLELAPGDSTVLGVSTLARAGDQTGTVTFSSDDPDEPTVVVTLAYHGLDPCSWELWKPDDGCDGGWPGTGVDGEVTLTSWAPTTTTLTTAAAGTVLAVADETGLYPDDELFLHDAASGRWAFARVVGIAPLTVEDPVDLPAGATVQRVPHYTNVHVDGAISGSRVVFRACGTVTVDGRLSADGGGWPGGRETTGIPELGWQGESEVGAGAQSDQANGTGGGGGSTSCNVHTDGGGGGHATAGLQGGDDRAYPCGGTGGLGGGTIGEETLTGLFFGGGAGGGYLDDDATAGSFGGAGGAGGGLVRIVATGFDGTGVIAADGGAGEDGFWIGGASPGGGGGGAGGTVWLTGPTAVTLSAVGGLGGIGSEAGSGPTNGGTGGDGRIRVDGALTATATPSAYAGCP